MKKKVVIQKYYMARGYIKYTPAKPHTRALDCFRNSAAPQQSWILPHHGQQCFCYYMFAAPAICYFGVVKMYLRIMCWGRLLQLDVCISGGHAALKYFIFTKSLRANCSHKHTRSKNHR